MYSESKLEEFFVKLQNFGFKIQKPSLIETALTHSSYIKLHNLPYINCNERLEFFGDSVLKLIASNFLYKKFKDKPEGYLSRIRSILVSDKCIEKIGLKLELDKLLRHNTTITMTMTASAFEALLGAIYLNEEFATLEKFIQPYLEDLTKEIIDNDAIYNAKNILQEYTQSQNQELPIYKNTKETGEAHNKIFEFSVEYNGNILAYGSGKSKKEAEQNAAYNACKKLGIIK